MEITDVEVIGLSHSLPAGEGIGDSRGFGHERATSLVRLETTDGVVGWGEAFAPGAIVKAILDEFFRTDVNGMDPFNAASIVDRSYADPYHFGGNVYTLSVASAIDIACWDIRGKVVGRPIHQLIGPNKRESVETYASTMYFTERDRPLADPVSAAIDEGFRAVKIKIGSNPAEDLARVRTAREVLGEDVRLMVDVNGNYRQDQALRMIDGIAESDLSWIEEPLPPGDYGGYRRLRDRTDVPIAAGEAHFARSDVKRLLDDRLVDIVQPNVTRCGGFTEARRIAEMASTENIAVRPHVWNSGVGLAAAIQFAASVSQYPHTRNVPDPMMVEFDRSPNPLRDAILAKPFDPTGGVLTVPQEPGLGIEVDEEALQQYRDI